MFLDKGAGRAMVRFTKAHGLGNDFVILDVFEDPGLASRPLHALAKSMCDRRRGVGADQLLTLEPASVDGAGVRMRVFNADGGEAEMCGNGVRCVARLAFERGYHAGDALLIETGAGLKACEMMGEGKVRVGMGAPRFDVVAVGFDDARAGRVEQRGRVTMAALEGVQGGLVSVGTPNFVVFTDSLVSIAFVTHRGSAIETHPCFPKRINVQFATRAGRDRVEVRSWERGAGLTEACGTGACAVFAVGRELGLLDSPATVALPGGELLVEADGEGQILKTGATTIVYRGEWAE